MQSPSGHDGFKLWIEQTAKDGKKHTHTQNLTWNLDQWPFPMDT